MKKYDPLLILVFILSIYILFSNQRITTSMDVDVLRYASNWIETGSMGSEQKLSAGVAYSPKTGLFYAMEGLGIIAPLAFFIKASNTFSSDSNFIMYIFNQFFAALASMFIFLIFRLFLSARKSFFYTALFALGTPLFVHSKYLLPEPVTLLCISMSFYYLLRFRSQKVPVYMFFSGLSTGYTLLTRPDAPIFAVLFSLLTAYTVYRIAGKDTVRSLVFYSAGFLIFAVLFAFTNYNRYGSFMESGYTLDRNEVKSSLEKSLPETYRKFESAARLVEREDPTDENYKEALRYYNSFQSQQKFLEETNKVLSEYGDKNTAFYTNGPLNFINGVYLILFAPNRSIFFLSPFMIILLISLRSFFRRFRTELILTGSIIAGYIVLYALRAPLSYAGSAAWGVRYLLPVYPVLFLSVIFYERSEFSRKTAVRRTFYGLCIISVLFQLTGSGVNYQSVQMPLEYKAKQVYGTSDMTWAHESRKSMMTDFSSSLLINNIRIMTGNMTPEQKAYGVEGGPNDWFFWQVLKGKGRLVEGKDTGSFKALLFLILISVAGSAYLLYRSTSAENK
ncbi:MAG TPA: glycosyltransferase family 39 protein [Clostridiales bacterium]|nr:glycosyltransferase family 39 protein [Clostridiales bacterium]